MFVSMLVDHWLTVYFIPHCNQYTMFFYLIVLIFILYRQYYK